jgi:hypothetical protein
MSGSLHADWLSVTCIASADSIVELARNTVNPVKCDWGAGTRTECNVMLGSWMLLKKVIFCYFRVFMLFNFFIMSASACYPLSKN